MRRLTLVLISMAVAALLVAVAGNLRPALALSVVPQGFTQTYVVGPPFSDSRAFDSPHDMIFAPDGRLFVAQQGGIVRIVNSDGTKSTFLDISNQVYEQNSMGLLGITLDPQFTTNRFVYLFYTAKATATTPIHNRIARVTANASGDSAVPGSEQVLLRMNELLDNGMHNGGSIKFGDDGKLYVSVGENNRRTPAQSLDNLFGKMVRINKDGTIPTSNPFYSTASGNNRAIWAVGLRNPFKFAVKPGTGTIFINDVGEKTWEEINRGASGANYGWNLCEGNHDNPNRPGSVNCSAAPYTAPVHEYTHGSTNTTGCSITGGTFYNPTTVRFPSGYVGDYFFADLCSGWIRRYDPSTVAATGFATGLSSVVDLEVSKNEGELYYLSRGTPGSVSKIR
jgi:glucose/arabinose dehydrogenase